MLPGLQGDIVATPLIWTLTSSRVAQAYVNQRKLDHEVKTLQVQASQFSKQTAQWISMVEGFNQALKVSCPAITSRLTSESHQNHLSISGGYHSVGIQPMFSLKCFYY